MNKKLFVLVLSIFCILLGCNTNLKTFDYAKSPGSDNAVERPDNLVEVQVVIKIGLAQEELQRGSLVTTFEIETEITKGQIPNNLNVKTIRLRCYHDWTDRLVKNGNKLTLRFTPEGHLFDIKEFFVTGVRN